MIDIQRIARLARCAGWAAWLTLTGCGSVSMPQALKGPRAETVPARIDGPPGVRLWQRDEPAAEVCALPCSTTLQPGRSYEARVVDLPDSPAFSVPSTARGVNVRVQVGPKVLPGLGVVTSTVGAAVMVVGGAIVLGDVVGDEDFAGAAPAGGITVAIGSAVLAAGIVLAALSGTHVIIEESKTGPAISF